jgi:Tc5 transposase DNA-binding domain/Fission yeast centromere protein N-terminal domain
MQRPVNCNNFDPRPWELRNKCKTRYLQFCVSCGPISIASPPLIAMSLTKNTLTDAQRRALCQYKKDNDNPALTLASIAKWTKEQFGFEVSISTISRTLARSDELLEVPVTINPNAKRHRTAKAPDVESVLYEWVLQYQEHVVISDEIRVQKAKMIHSELSPDTAIEFSPGWLSRFKQRHGIKLRAWTSLR